MEMNFASFKAFSDLKNLCRTLIQNPKDHESIGKLNDLIKDSPKSFVKVIQPTVLSTFYPVLKSISENKHSFSSNEKQRIIDVLQSLFEKSVIENIGLFFNVYAFLLFEIYDHTEEKLLPVQEDYKFSIIECTKSLVQAVSSEIILELYTKANATKLSPMLYVAIDIAKNEQLKKLRISAIECIMCFARVYTDDDFNDIVVSKQIAEVFLFFLPGITSGLAKIALEDEKIGHKIPAVSLRAWARIVALLMQNYNSPDIISDISNLKIHPDELDVEKKHSKKFSSKKEVDEYISNGKISPKWYSETDKKLQGMIVEFKKLAHHSHEKVRLSLTELCKIILEKCLGTMPLSCSHLIEIVIALTEDEDHNISNENHVILQNLSSRFSTEKLKALLENLEEGFIEGVNSLPRKFNGIDKREQVASINLLMGYLKLFGEHKLNQVLLPANRLNNLLTTISHISELDRKSTGLIEEYPLKDLNQSVNSKTPWKKFVRFKDELLGKKIEDLCNLLGRFSSLKMVCDFLLDVIIDDRHQRCEAIFILNGVITGINSSSVDKEIIADIIETYTDDAFLQVPLAVNENVTLAEVQNNSTQVCLLIEGIGNVAALLKEDFKTFMLKTLHILLEKAGSNNSLVRSAGIYSLKIVSRSCQYEDIEDLIIKNIDYFTYHIERKLNKSDGKNNVFIIFSVVLKYSSIEVLPYLAHTIQEVLVQSCDRYKENNIDAYLEVFRIFIKSLKSWLKIDIKEECFKTREEKRREYEEFKVTGANETVDISDDEFEGKTAEEMYEEDRKKRELEEEIDEEPEENLYKKPDPPLEIKLAVAILKRSLHFLPSKDKQRKLLVLEILADGLELIRDWEDELLPIIHLIWSPLVQRFKDYNDPVTINYSFQLLVTMARLSKEFIRMRTVKEVLPHILEFLEGSSKSSYLKDKGSAYRYSQIYKLQIKILENLAMVVINLDVDDTTFSKVSSCVYLYLSNKQPIPLQEAAIKCLKVIAKFDPVLFSKCLQCWNVDKNGEYEKNINTLIELDSISLSLN
ncbi:unnamed protein product [Phyllotreta striolata]|uniref:TELO2-interacting protein 1 n=1 Tax=Phyllotreta striolata TaxID=444603 RepID=A0A9N9TT44_PHYSR|nr:unnamed protein product [Phyllotreta striolata]